MFGEELTEHRGVLVGDRGAELRQHAGRKVERRRDRVEVAGARAGAGADQHLVRLAGGDDLLHQRIDGGAAAVDDALAADLDHRRVRQDPKIGRLLRRGLKVRIGQRALHEERLQLRCRVRHRVLPSPGSDAPSRASPQARLFPAAGPQSDGLDLGEDRRPLGNLEVVPGFSGQPGQERRALAFGTERDDGDHFVRIDGLRRDDPPRARFRIELAPGGSRVRLTSLAKIRMRRRSPAETASRARGSASRGPSAREGRSLVVALDPRVERDRRVARHRQRQGRVALKVGKWTCRQHLALLHQHHLVGEPLDLGDVVGDVDDRQRQPSRSRSRNGRISLLVTRSSADSGSSIRSSFGCDSSARPIATRCLSPPERLRGLRARSGVTPSRSVTSSNATRLLAASPRGAPNRRFLRTERCGNRLASWNT